MAKKIHLLPPQLANQIAAGEVVERPGSVVKELLENSIDANAKRIQVDIENGGVKLMRIRDDGDGIGKDDLALALSRHATSKIYELTDLTAIGSLGFRGEALASIASVSRLNLTSCLQGESRAWCATLHGRDMSVNIEPASHPQGTTVEVRDLFFNTPARRKFLRTERTEFFHIEEIVKRIALSRFDIGFMLRHNQKIMFNLRVAEDDGAKDKRVASLCGSQFIKNCERVEFNAVGLRLWGWLGNPEIARSQNDLQYFYVNGRVVRDKLLNHAIRQAYQDHLYDGKHACYVLFLECCPETVDVNVHPTKHEVRFHESRLVHDFVFSQLQRALTNAHVSTLATVEIDAEPEVMGSEQPRNTVAPRTPQTRPSATAVREQLAGYRQMTSPAKQTQQAFIPTTNSDPRQLPLGRVLGLVLENTIVCESEGGLVLVDYHHAQRCVIAQQLLQAWQGEAIPSQPLLFPASIQCSGETLALFNKAKDEFVKVGLSFDQMGPTMLMVREAPAPLRKLDFAATFEALSVSLLTQDDFKKTLQVLAVHGADVAVKQQDRESLNRCLRQCEQLSKEVQPKPWIVLDKARLKELVT